MAFDRERAFEIPENGFLIEGGTHVISGASSPLALSISPTSPTIFFQTNGTIWSHDGLGSWIRAGSINFFFHKIDQDVTIPNNQQMTVEGGDFEVTVNGHFSIEPEAKFKLRE